MCFRWGKLSCGVVLYVLWTESVSTGLLRFRKPIADPCPRAFPCQDSVPWSKVKKNGQPSGSRCARCVEAVKQAWPLRTFEDVLAEKCASESFARTVKDVMSRHDGVAPRNFLKESLDNLTHTGLMIERQWRFFSRADFQKKILD